MDILDHALESSQEKSDSPVSDEAVHLAETTDEQAAAIASVTGAGHTMTLDASVAFPGQVTYRVVQVNQEGGETAVVATPFTQTVIPSPFSNGGSPTGDGSGEARFTYFPAVSADGTAGQTDGITGAAISTTGGQFYLMMSPQDVLQGQRNLAPRTSFTPKMEPRTSRDDRRRATHNEVERRRRDKINNWIVQLSKLVPDCAADTNKQGQVRLSGSKGGILAKACDHINDLRSKVATVDDQLQERTRERDRLINDNQILSQQVEDYKTELTYLHSIMQQHGIAIPEVHKASGP